MSKKQQSYYAELGKIDFFKVRPEMIPFVGEEYDTYKVLQLSESHYFHHTSNEPEEFGIKYFVDKWLELDPCEEFMMKYGGSVNTREDIIGFMRGETENYPAYYNFLKAMSEGVLGKSIETISRGSDEQKLFKYIAYTDYFMMPALYFDKKHLPDSVKLSIERLPKDEQELYKYKEVMEKIVDFSDRVIEQVIDILKPRAIVFTSKKGGDFFRKHNIKYANDKRMIYAYHPSNICGLWANSEEYGHVHVVAELKKIYS